MTKFVKRIPLVLLIENGYFLEISSEFSGSRSVWKFSGFGGLIGE